MFARRLRAVVRNAIVWGIGWGLIGAVVVTAMLVTGNAPPDATWFRAIGLAVRVGVVGSFAGAIFAAATILLYRGRRMREMHWARFGIAGAVISATTIPLLLQLLNILSGDGMVAWSELTDDIPLLAVLGGGAAAVWLKLAQRADPARETDGASADAVPVLTSADTPATPMPRPATTDARPGR